LALAGSALILAISTDTGIGICSLVRAKVPSENRLWFQNRKGSSTSRSQYEHLNQFSSWHLHIRPIRAGFFLPYDKRSFLHPSHTENGLSALPTDGLVEVIGKAAQAATTSPLNQTKCVGWQVEVQGRRILIQSGAKGSWYYRFKVKRKAIAPIELFDTSGKLWVDPTGADLILKQDLEEKSGWIDSLDFQTDYAIRKLGINTNGVQKVKESIISAEDEILVLGKVDISDGQKRIKKARSNPLIISDFGKADLLTKLYGKITKLFLLITMVGGVCLFIPLIPPPINCLASLFIFLSLIILFPFLLLLQIYEVSS
jgi:hypothetical protein